MAKEAAKTNTTINRDCGRNKKQGMSMTLAIFWDVSQLHVLFIGSEFTVPYMCI